MQQASGGGADLSQWKRTSIRKFIEPGEREFEECSYNIPGKIKMVFVVSAYSGLCLGGLYTQLGTYSDAGYLDGLIIEESN